MDAVDFTINYGSFPQQIQVKCTQKPKRVTYQKKECFSYSIDEKWNIQWRKSLCPPLFALVVIPSNIDIFSFLDEGSLIRDTKAYWTRITDCSKKTVHIPVDNLITEQVIRGWEQFAIDLFVGIGGEDK